MLNHLPPAKSLVWIYSQHFSEKIMSLARKTHSVQNHLFTLIEAFLYPIKERVGIHRIIRLYAENYLEKDNSNRPDICLL